MKTVVCFFLLSVLCVPISHAQVRILTTEEPPTNYTVQGELVGITTDIVKAIQKQLKSDAKIAVFPWARAYKIAQTKPNVLVFTVGRSPERVAHGFHFIGPVTTRTHALWSKKGSNLDFARLEDLDRKSLVIGAMRGDWREKYFRDAGFQVEEVTNHYMSLKMLLAGRFQLMASSDLEAPQIAREIGVDTNSIEIAYEIKKSGSYMMFSRDTPLATVEQWRNAFAALQETDFFSRTAKKWSDLLGYELVYAKEMGFYARPKSKPEPTSKPTSTLHK